MAQPSGDEGAIWRHKPHQRHIAPTNRNCGHSFFSHRNQSQQPSALSWGVSFLPQAMRTGRKTFNVYITLMQWRYRSIHQSGLTPHLGEKFTETVNCWVTRWPKRICPTLQRTAVSLDYTYLTLHPIGKACVYLEGHKWSTRRQGASCGHNTGLLWTLISQSKIVNHREVGRSPPTLSPVDKWTTGAPVCLSVSKASSRPWPIPTQSRPGAGPYELVPTL